MNSLIWLIVLAIFILIEIFTLGLTTIWFAGGSLIAFFISLGIDNFVIELAVCLIISFLLLYFTRPVAIAHFNGKRSKTNYESIIGGEARVIEKIDNFNNSGQVVIAGQEWTARSLHDSIIIDVGKKVIVKNITGVKVIVECEKEDI